MVDKTQIESLYGIVGFRGSYDPDYDILDTDNQVSRSGLYVDDNAFCKVEFIKDSSDYIDLSDADFNEALKNMQLSAISNVCNSVFPTVDYIDRNLLFKNAFNKQDTDALPDGFVGYRIKITDEKSVAFQIKRVFLDFDGTDTITLMLFNSATKTVVYSEAVVITTDHQEVTLDWVLNDLGGLYKGEYYFGYNTTGLAVTPYQRDYNSGNLMSYITYLNVYQMKVPNHNTATLFDLDDVEGLSTSTGLNPDITVYNDYTDLIIRNENLFAEAINYAVAIKCIGSPETSLRSNRNKRINEQNVTQMRQLLEGDSREGHIQIKGLIPSFNGAILALREQINKLKTGYLGPAIKVQTFT